MTAPQYLMYIEEETYGVPKLTTGAPTTAAFGYIRLLGDNAFTIAPSQDSVKVAYGGGVATNIARIPGRITAEGTLTTVIHYTQAAALLGWALTPINTGRTAPWTTSADTVQGPGDLASMSLYHAVRQSDGTYYKRAYHGAKVRSMRLECSADDPLVRATLNISAGQPVPDAAWGGAAVIGASEFPAPADGDYPDPTKILHYYDSAGHVVIGGTTRTLYGSLMMEVNNIIDTKYYTSRYASVISYRGRNTTAVQIKSLFTPTPTDRNDYETNAAKTVVVTFTNGVNSVAIDFKANNRQDTPPAYDLPNERTYEQTITYFNFYDVANTADFVLTVS
jgi:hypothetical protein